MGDTLITVVAIFLAAILMFVFPLMTVSERGDDVSQLAVQSATVEFVDKVRTTGKLSLEDYSKYVQTINSTGNTFEPEIEIKILDENPGKKTAQTDYTKIGENVYYTMYTTQVMDQIIDSASSKGKTLVLKEGDIISVSAKNTNTTIAQTLRNAFYKVTGQDTYQIEGSHSGIVTVNGTKR